jgi:hypothetical protein
MRWVLIGLAYVVAACGGDGRSGHQLEMVTDTIGDTVVVRTVGGSVWGDTAVLQPEMSFGVFEGPDEYMLGRVRSLAVAESGEIHLLDSQVPALRKYSADGKHIATFGREGGGPGEYKQPDAGLAVLSDGRVVLRDPGNSRFSIFARDGEFIESWRIPGGFNTGRKLYRDGHDNVYTLVLLERGLAPWDWTYGLARYQPDGTHTDTVLTPTWDYERPALTGQSEGSSSSSGVPFTADDAWTFSPLGYPVGGVATDYRVDLYRPDGVLRIEKAWDPVPVLGDEKDEQERRIRGQFERNFPGWRWNGPAIPDTKPAFSSLHVGEDGRIWVRLHQRGRPVMSVEEARDEEQRTNRPQVRYREPIAFDVFEPDGRYLGHISAPQGFTMSPEPVFRGDFVWAVSLDDLDVPTVVRYRIVLPSET